MKKIENKGILYIVSTPIGNLKDITIRAINTLKEVDFIAVEDKRRAKKLLSAYAIDGKIVSYREENRERMTEEIVKFINGGKNIALISDAGTPTISDPGDYLINRCIEEGIVVVPIPGPTSIICALSASGLDTSGFVFFGFLDRKGKKRANQLLKLVEEKRTSVIFESPKRILKTLTDILENIGDVRAVLCRELTKLHEEIIRGKVSEIAGEIVKRGEVKGEIVLLISGRGEGKDDLDRDILIEKVKRLLKENSGKRGKEIAKEVAAEFGIPARDVYEIILREKGK